MATFIGAILKCQECGKGFKVPPTRKDTAKYCSIECADGHRNDKRKVEQIKKVCKQCGKTFHDHPCHIERRNYCSYECAKKATSDFWFEKSIGDDNHFYTRSFWKKLRSLILERDRYRCQICGEENKKLNVHHIKEKRNGGTDHKDNLITLCVNCHRRKHKNYDYLRACHRLTDRVGR
jgi:hypothetical protein